MAQVQKMINGVDTEELNRWAKEFTRNPNLAKFQFHASNKWIRSGHSQTSITDFYGAGERLEHQQMFVLEADEPPILVGEDIAPNPVEHLLNALITCLTSSLVYHAAVRGIQIDAVESTISGDLDMRGFMNLSRDVRTGYQVIRVNFRVKSDAPAEKLKECARFSPVLDVVSNGTKIELNVETWKETES